MFRLSKKTDYCLMALKHILSKRSRPSSAREISEAYDIPFEVLAKLLQKLARKGFVIAQHGTKGGYSPSHRLPSRSVRDVMEAIEGPLAVISCYQSGKGPCEQEEKCSVRQPLVKVQAKVIDVLSTTTLHEI